MIRRTIHLYRASVYHADGSHLEDPTLPWRVIASMPYQGAVPCRCLTFREQDHSAKVQLFPGVVFGRFGAVKYNDLPRKKDSEERETEIDLEADEGLDYVCHFNWYNFAALPNLPDRTTPSSAGLLVWEHNQQAPRVTGFATYLGSLFGGRLHFEFIPLIDEDAWSRFNAVDQHGTVTVRIERPTAIDSAAAGQDSIMNLWRRPWSTTTEVEVVLKPRRRRKHFRHEIAADIRHWADLPEVTKLSLAEEGGQILDLLNHRIRYSREVPRLHPQSRCVDPGAVHEEMQRVFIEERARVATTLGRQMVPGTPLGVPDPGLAPSGNL